MRPTCKPRKRKIPKHYFCHGAPDEVVGRAFALPDDLSMSGDFLDWGSEYDAKIRLPEPPPPLRSELRGVLVQAASALTREQQIAEEVERAMRMPPDELRVWFAVKEKAHLAALANPMPWGGAA